MLAMPKQRLLFSLGSFLDITLDTGSSVVLYAEFVKINMQQFITYVLDIHTYAHRFCSRPHGFYVWTLKHKGISDKMTGN